MILTSLIIAGTVSYALAAVSGTVTASVTPSTPKAGSSIQATASNFTPASTLPTSLTITLQKGFTTAVDRRNRADSVKVLCTPTQESNDACPTESQVGQGSANATVSGALPGTAVTEAINLVFFLGEAPAASTCPAGVDVVFKGNGFPTEHAIGTLCRYQGGLQLSFSNLPTYSSLIPSGFTVTLNRLRIAAGASTTTRTTKRVKRHGHTTRKVTQTVHHLLNNPSSCPTSGAWSGSFSVTFGSSGTDTQPLTLACRV
jgi:hypothetical protein